MTLTVTVYDWRLSLCPMSARVEAGGLGRAGGLLLGGAAQINPEPGGRAVMHMIFQRFWTSIDANLDVEWTLSRIRNGAVMRIPVGNRSRQLLPTALITGTPASYTVTPTYIPAQGVGAPVWDPKLAVAANAAKGAAVVQVGMSTLGSVLKPGHVVGFRDTGLDFVHKVMDVTYAGATATLTISPPLRRAVTTSSFCQLRPAIMGTCLDPGSAAGEDVFGKAIGLNPLVFVEALL